MTIDAVLERLVLSSPQPQQVAEFYCAAFDYRLLDTEDECRCEGPGRSLWIRRGIANQLIESHFCFPDENMLERYAQNLTRQGVPHTFENGSSPGVLNVTDPDGRRVLFTASRNDSNSSVTSRDTGGSRSARLQHYAVRTPNPQGLVDFYSQTLSFRISDLVRDGSGDLTAAFLRTDAEHHALAIFRAPEKRFDHFSCETRDWSSLRDWADALAARRVRIVWGIGRHGPGNDTFFMVLDPDGNLAEISAELETCAEDRPIGLWEHRMETLNQWGVAIMRS